MVIHWTSATKGLKCNKTLKKIVESKSYKTWVSGMRNPDNLLKICGALRDLVPFVRFKKREKRPWRSVNFSKVEKIFKDNILIFLLTASIKYYDEQQIIFFANIYLQNMFVVAVEDMNYPSFIDDHSFRMYTKISEKITFLIPR